MFKGIKGALLASVLAAVMATPAAAIPMTDTLFGEVTEIVDPAFALDYEVGTPATLSATWDTDDLFSLAFIGLPELAAVSIADNPADSSLSITLGGHSWTEEDEGAFGIDFGSGAVPTLSLHQRRSVARCQFQRI